MACPAVPAVLPRRTWCLIWPVPGVPGRQISAPVCIPGAANQRAVSSDHLWALDRAAPTGKTAAAPRTPASAPAASNMPVSPEIGPQEPSKESKGPSFASGSGEEGSRVAVPPTPLHSSPPEAWKVEVRAVPPPIQPPAPRTCPSPSPPPVIQWLPALTPWGPHPCGTGC
eukprot:jgi/Botrbrau1/19358/Bobra.0628s0003.1